MLCCSFVTRLLSRKSFTCCDPLPILHLHTSVTLMVSGTFLVMSSMCIRSWGLLGCKPQYIPVCAGGIGIKSTARSAGTVCLSGLHCGLRQPGPPDPWLQDTTNPCVECATTTWSQVHSQASPTPPTTHCQRAWDALRIKALLQILLESSRDPTTRARLLAVATKKSGTWLNALPVASLGLRLDNEVVRIAVGLRLGFPLCHPHQCIHCEAEVNDWGTLHGLSCHFSKGRHSHWCCELSHQGLRLVTLLGAQLGILGSMAEESAVFSSSSVTSDGELSEGDLAEYSSLVRPYQDEPLAGEDTTENEDELDADGLSPGILQDRYERAMAVDSW